MKNTFMDGIQYNEKHGPETYGPQVGKLRRDFYELTEGNVPEEDVAAYVHRLMEQPQNFGKDGNALVWALGKPTDMPSDGCEEFVCQPTYLATGFIVYAVQHYNAVKTISGIFPFLHDALSGCLWGGLGGHGYEYAEGLIDTMTIFADCGMDAFLEAYPDVNADFKNVFDETVKYIEEELCTGKERNEWNNASYENFAVPLLLKLKPSLQQRLLFVYGTLMRSGHANDHLSDCTYIGKAILKDYAMFKLDWFPGIVPQKGKWVEGELYIIHDGDFSGLDRYEGEGDLYRREIVTVESSFGPLQAWAYVYLEKPEGKAMHEPWIKNDDDVVWYAGYGSNLSKERFLYYVKGGYCAANGKTYDGCTNKQLVSDKDDRAWFPGQMYFGNKSKTWNHKGVAFYDPNATKKTFMRMYKVTWQQLKEIQRQESPNLIWYDRIQALGIHSDGCPIYTLTSGTRYPDNAPDESYLSLIKEALIEENGFTKEEANNYLAGCLKENNSERMISETDVSEPRITNKTKTETHVNNEDREIVMPDPFSHINKNADVLKQAAEFILNDKTEEAGAVIREKYPFVPPEKDSRSNNKTEQMKQFFKDGFIDRYFGTKLINPGMLRVLSVKLPEEFPYHKNWKTDKCHIAYWDYSPSIDHIIPISRGGKDEPSNRVTTSMKGNLAKSNYTLEQLNLEKQPEGDIHAWDGLSGLFVEIVDNDQELKRISGIREWYNATKRVMKENGLL